MKLLTFNYDSIKKYIVYSEKDATIDIYCVYKIFTKKCITELIHYKYGHIDSIFRLNCILNFNENEPLESINKFYKAFILQ